MTQDASRRDQPDPAQPAPDVDPPVPCPQTAGIDPAVRSALSTKDWIQERFVAQAIRRRMSPYRIWRTIGGVITENCIADYYYGRSAMRSDRLSILLRAVGLDLVERAEPDEWWGT